MTTEATPTEEVVNETPVVPEAPKELRDALAREKDTSHGYRVQLMSSAYETLGLSPETGLGKAIAKEYTGEPDAEAVAKFAKEEYGYEAPETPEKEALTKAEAEGDYATAGAIKAKRVEEMFRRR